MPLSMLVPLRDMDGRMPLLARTNGSSEYIVELLSGFHITWHWCIMKKTLNQEVNLMKETRSLNVNSLNSSGYSCS